MELMAQVQAARKTIVTDGYEMSIGEIINLYKDNELRIDPEFQRLFRWNDEQKTRFIESLILGIPIPPIFVHQDDTGIWELIDGLQRVSTILQLTGDLKGERAQKLGPLVLNGTRFLPGLDGRRWQESSTKARDGIGRTLQIEIKRARIRIEILKSESDASAKFELFQRLNTGGAILTPQEVRNCIAVSLNRQFHQWLVERSNEYDFKHTTCQTDTALKSQAGVELALRFFAFRNAPYKPGMDVHEYLDQALWKMATGRKFDAKAETEVFTKTFRFLKDALDDKAFKRWDGTEFVGKFLFSIYEVMAIGVSHNLAAIEALDQKHRNEFIRRVATTLAENPIFKQYSGAGVRGTTRLSRLLSIGPKLLRP